MLSVRCSLECRELQILKTTRILLSTLQRYGYIRPRLTPQHSAMKNVFFQEVFMTVFTALGCPLVDCANAKIVSNILTCVSIQQEQINNAS